MCLLMIPKKLVLSSTAYQRLKAIEQHTMLGSGYDVALKDLEIRGAGNLFGFKQSGHMGAVGFEMYCKILRETVDETLGVSTTGAVPPRVIFDGPALLPSGFIPLVEDRLYLYQRLSESFDIKTVDDIKNEIRDRFGPLPESAENLITVARIRAMLVETPVTFLHVKSAVSTVHLSSFSEKYSPETFVVELAKRIPPHLAFFKLKPGRKESIILEISPAGGTEIIIIIKAFVKLFSLKDSN